MRNLKALGLALVAVLAISAMAAAAAQAEAPADFNAAEYPATLDATGENVQKFTVDGQTFTCGTGNEGEAGFVSGVHASGTLLEESPSGTVTGISGTHCHVVSFGITFPITVDAEGCDAKINAGTYEASLGTHGGSRGSAEIECEAEKEITITVFNSGDENHEEAPRCVLHIPPQEVQGDILYTNITVDGKEAVTVESTNNAVEITKTDTNTFGCNSHVTDPEAEYEGAGIARATNSSGELIDGSVTPT